MLLGPIDSQPSTFQEELEHTAPTDAGIALIVTMAVLVVNLIFGQGFSYSPWIFPVGLRGRAQSPGAPARVRAPPGVPDGGLTFAAGRLKIRFSVTNGAFQASDYTSRENLRTERRRHGVCNIPWTPCNVAKDWSGSAVPAGMRVGDDGSAKAMTGSRPAARQGSLLDPGRCLL